ncbi:hypothetical protein LTR62_001278 [Meristemomyces frigidus]|uniref:Methyltransferase domain-containing protein n=1 Tax=Meristemomyces frigidus TaxID=1508187 RepID=A0AAN7YGE5_9PEZI|nr:hypothetical protein LTR62_001278 [Meristemomyces frigidus]
MESTKPLSSNSSVHSELSHTELLNRPYELRHGRRYLRSLPYPLPVDLPEIQRQNLRTLLGCRVFGRAVCSPNVAKQVPQKVLELGCGSGYWSSMCHDYFSSHGFREVSFTGLDVAPLAPNFNKQGMKWTFVQHDMRRLPLPFDDEAFDLIMLKDLSLVLHVGEAFQKFLDDCIRMLAEGGTLEIWESDHVMRSLLPHPPPPSSKQPYFEKIATQTATFLIAPGTPFAPAQNKFLRQANAWITEALDKRRFSPAPCARLSQVLYQETETLANIGVRRVAIPLGELRWEREALKQSRDNRDSLDPLSGGKRKAKMDEPLLTQDQLAIRETALLSVLQMIEGLEPLLREVSGKNAEEWGAWWLLMMANLLDPAKGGLGGECVEVGAWWATKLTAK